jgi:hypothetical protein
MLRGNILPPSSRLNEIGCKYYSQMVQNRVQWWYFVNAAVNTFHKKLTIYSSAKFFKKESAPWNRSYYEVNVIIHKFP